MHFPNFPESLGHLFRDTLYIDNLWTYQSGTNIFLRHSTKKFIGFDGTFIITSQEVKRHILTRVETAPFSIYTNSYHKEPLLSQMCFRKNKIRSDISSFTAQHCIATKHPPGRIRDNIQGKMQQLHCVLWIYVQSRLISVQQGKDKKLIGWGLQ